MEDQRPGSTGTTRRRMDTFFPVRRPPPLPPPTPPHGIRQAHFEASAFAYPVTPPSTTRRPRPPVPPIRYVEENHQPPPPPLRGSIPPSMGMFEDQHNRRPPFPPPRRPPDVYRAPDGRYYDARGPHQTSVDDIRGTDERTVRDMLIG